MQNIISKIPYQITGDRYEELLKYDANSRKKISILGWSVIIPSFLWFISSFLLCYKILGTEFWIAMVAGIIAAIVIFIFERNIVQSAKTNWILTFLRVSLGIFIALFSSVILDLVIFKNDIDYFAKAKKIEAQEQKIKQLQSNYKDAEDRFNKEMDGASNTKMKGFGQIAKEKKEQARGIKVILDQEENDLKTLKENYSITNNSSLNHTFSDLGLNTILNRIKLLHEFVNQNILAFWAWFILLMIGVLLEIFGVLTKCFYPKSIYEEDMDAISIIMANNRKVVLEKSIYYTNLGIHGRAAMNQLENNAPKILNFR